MNANLRLLAVVMLLLTSRIAVAPAQAGFVADLLLSGINASLHVKLYESIDSVEKYARDNKTTDEEGAYLLKEATESRASGNFALGLRFLASDEEGGRKLLSDASRDFKRGISQADRALIAYRRAVAQQSATSRPTASVKAPPAPIATSTTPSASTTKTVAAPITTTTPPPATEPPPPAVLIALCCLAACVVFAPRSESSTFNEYEC